MARKTIVLYVVQKLLQDFPQASKTSVGHVVQLLYRASCFNVSQCTSVIIIMCCVSWHLCAFFVHLLCRLLLSALHIRSLGLYYVIWLWVELARVSEH